MLLIYSQDSFSILSLMPHGACYLWKPGLVGLHSISNGLIALAYFSIPINLSYVLNKRSDTPFNDIYWLFASFIIFCGLGHAFDIWTLWHPNYWISGAIKAVTAIVSILTGIILYVSIPEILSFPSINEIKNSNLKLQQTTEELLKEQQFVKTLLNNVSDCIVTCDSQGKLTLFNRAAEKIHGVPNLDIPPKQWANHYNLYRAEKKLMNLEEIPLYRAFMGESLVNAELTAVSQQGNLHHFLVNGDPILTSDGQKLGAVVVMRDVSHLKKMERALQESQKRFQQIFIHASVGMAIVDLEGKWLEVNPALAKMTGYTVPELQATDFQTITDPQDLKLDLERVEQLLSGEISYFHLEKRYIHKQGYTFWVKISVSLLRNEQKHPLYFIALVENIDEQKKAEEALTTLNHQLEQKVKQRTEELEKRNEELNQFAYVASHDLKAPLRGIANLASWIEEDLEEKLDEENRHNLQLLKGRVNRLENLINGLLSYSRVGRVNSQKQDIDLGELLTEIISSLDIPDEFKVEIIGEMPKLYTYRTPLEQVFSNLIINGVKHHNRKDGNVKISMAQQERYYEFFVSDDGVGIEPRYHQKIFQIFQTLESRDVKESTGIGLAVVKKAVESQGGTISVKSQLAEGTTFRFTWPK